MRPAATAAANRAVGELAFLADRTDHDRAVRGRLSLVPQQDALFDHLDALQMVTVSAQGHGVSDPTAAAVTALNRAAAVVA